tara:strand:+ start:1306 stop:2805 length:1500 start_codon:yes stop_codon:yes gene_type:complete
MKTKILDCTLRDGGYYTNWDFDLTIVEDYIKHTNNLPLDYIEIGYRNPKNLNIYNGEFYYTPINTLKLFNQKSKHKVAVMIDYKNVQIHQINSLLKECKGYVNLIRVAIKPDSLDNIQDFIDEIKKLGFETALNIMYLSRWDIEKIKDKIKNIQNLDYLYLADSYGAVFPEELEKILNEIKKVSNCSIGFHSHDNLELAFSNTLTSIKNGIDIVDSSILGMGRGAGNLKTELLLIKLSFRNKNRFKQYDSLSSLIELFTPLKLKYNWGSDISYKFAGINSFPQKEIMSLKLSKNYKFSQIIRYFDNKEKEKVNLKDIENQKDSKKNQTIIIGGGPSILKHKKAIDFFLEKNKDRFNLILSSSKFSELIPNNQKDVYQIVLGSDMVEYKLLNKKNIKYIFPSTDGLDEKDLKENFYSIKVDDNITEQVNHFESSMYLASKILRSKKVFLIGFDGFNPTDDYYNVFKENQKVIDKYSNNIPIISLTRTKYSTDLDSIYSYI